MRGDWLVINIEGILIYNRGLWNLKVLLITRFGQDFAFF